MNCVITEKIVKKKTPDEWFWVLNIKKFLKIKI